MLAVLAILAVSGLYVGVTNDAVNFLNAAIGSRVAKMRTILSVASVGILIGVLTSTGMMEVARSGMFNPGLFTFHEIMILYVSVMFANVILLDIYNSLGLPTSTTVALVFSLLGAAIAVSLFKISGDPSLTLGSLGIGLRLPSRESSPMMTYLSNNSTLTCSDAASIAMAIGRS